MLHACICTRSHAGMCVCACVCVLDKCFLLIVCMLFSLLRRRLAGSAPGCASICYMTYVLPMIAYSICWYTSRLIILVNSCII